MSGGAVANRCGDAGVPGQLSRSNWNEGRERKRRWDRLKKGSSTHPQRFS